MSSLTQTLANLEQVDLQEGTAWGDPVPFTDYPNNDWLDIASGSFYTQAYTTINDRSDGRFYPIYYNEQDLARIRAQVRRFVTLSELSEAVTKALKVYIFGKGIAVSASPIPKVDVPAKLVENITRIVDRFVDQNQFCNSMDLELLERAINDGETQIGLDVDRFKPRSICADFMEADQLTQPRSPGELHDWISCQYGIDCSAFDVSWSFGVLTPKRRTSQPLGYHVIFDAAGQDFEFYPEDQFIHIKKNVPRAAKRGVSDWWCPKECISQAAKLRRNMAHGAALQSAIAWIEESPTGTTSPQLPGIGNLDGQYQKPTNIGAGGGTRTQRQTTYGPGSILRPTPGRKYVAGPMGSERNAGYTIVEQMLERLVATRFLMPYYMISADASNNNFASSLVAESPFVKARESDQEFYGSHIKDLLWKVVKLAWRNGWLDTCGVPFGRLKEYVNIVVDFPQVATRDRSALVQQLVQEVTVLGTTSIETAAADLGRDYEEEVAKGARPDSTSINAPGSPGTRQQVQQSSPNHHGEMSNLSTRQFNRNKKAMNMILDEFKSGKASRAHAKQLLLALGMKDERAEALLIDAEESRSAQPVSESWEEYP